MTRQEPPRTGEDRNTEPLAVAVPGPRWGWHYVAWKQPDSWTLRRDPEPES